MLMALDKSCLTSLSGLITSHGGNGDSLTYSVVETCLIRLCFLKMPTQILLSWHFVTSEGVVDLSVGDRLVIGWYHFGNSSRLSGPLCLWQCRIPYLAHVTLRPKLQLFKVDDALVWLVFLCQIVVHQNHHQLQAPCNFNSTWESYAYKMGPQPDMNDNDESSVVSKQRTI